MPALLNISMDVECLPRIDIANLAAEPDMHLDKGKHWSTNLKKGGGKLMWIMLWLQEWTSIATSTVNSAISIKLSNLWIQ